MPLLKDLATTAVSCTATVVATVAAIGGESAMAASGIKLGTVMVAGNPVGAAVFISAAAGVLIYKYCASEYIDPVVKTVVVNPISTVLSLPITVIEKLVDAFPKPVEVKPFPMGNAEPRTSYKCVASKTMPREAMQLKWMVRSQTTEPKKDRRKDDDDKDPDCNICIPSTDEAINELSDLIKKLSNLLETIRKMETSMQDARKGLFQKLLDLLEELIHTHGSVFKRSEMGIELIPFRLDQVETVTGQCPPKIFLGKLIQNFYENMVTIFSTEKRNLESNLDFKGVIYCIQCQLCRTQNMEFNYVGQSVNTMKDRGKMHFSVIKKNTGHLLHDHLVEHEIDVNIDSLSEAYKMYSIHDLSDNATSPRASPSCQRKTDARIRRSWEMFYQWAFKASHFDGGGSKK
uniref:Uncharacterized protein n=1 Tax=Daphnia galeata TaxID=27404 RepID=A0A8J2RTS6_9CRUS|nr:unnamed protein product [Daphnia galeata]